MDKKYIYALFTFLFFASLCVKVSFCRAEIKEGAANMEKQRKQIVEYAQKGDHESAIKSAEEYIKSDPGNIEILVTLAGSYLSVGNFSQAETMVKKALGVSSNNTWVITTLAKIYRAEAEQSKVAADKKKLFNLAEVEIEKVLAVEPENPWVNAEAALIYLGQGKKDDANKAIKKAIDAQPNDKYITDIKSKIAATP